MIQINQLKLPVGHSKEDLEWKIRKSLRLGKGQEISYEIIRQSLDARKKNEKKFVYSIQVNIPSEKQILKKVSNNNIMLTNPVSYHFPKPGEDHLNHRPVIVGSGPAGLFCGYLLAQAGYAPIILERGEPVRQRHEKVTAFWKGGPLDTRSNVQFGEGGAGTFSDGKLNTLVKDPVGRNKEVLRIFVECGAPEEIIYQQKPHLGTDVLMDIVETMRHRIEDFGGTFRFSSQVTDLRIRENRLTGVVINETEELLADVVILAIGHSARDTFQMLYEKGIFIKPKSFAVGLRVEHPQKMINQALYGEEENKILGAAAYKLTAKALSGRGVYTFCMCPGGYVVNASSEEGRLAVNGMSYSGRDSENANSALIVTVGPEDFKSSHPLAGIDYQRNLEEAMYRLAGGKIPVQLYEDFKDNRPSDALGEVHPCIKGDWMLANIRSILPSYLSEGIETAMEDFGRKIPGFNRRDALLCGLESRTSSPVRIERGETLESNISGLYPCGEGAGYAGGITSAAMDGLKIAEQIAKRYTIWENEA